MEKFWKGKEVFITGASGFLGSWLTKTLVGKGANVTCLIRDLVPSSYLNLSGTIKQVNVVYGCLEDYSVIERALNEYEIDSCFHLGAQAIVGAAVRFPMSTFESNIKGTWNILECVRQNRKVKRVVVASSDKAYGTKGKLPYKEDNCLQGMHPYDVSKSCTDLLAQSYYHTYGVPVAISRCGNFYGGGDLNSSRIVPGTIKSLILDQHPLIRSDGTYIRDYFYIEDVVDAYLSLGENVDREEIVGQAFNFGTGQPITVLDLVKLIIRISGKHHLKPVILNEAKNEIKEQYLSSEKARNLLSWEPRFSLEEGLKRTYKWYEAFLEEKVKLK